eukprot:TRINITY_DN2692_c0_g1_i3.p1 TRINITY_DN2692_c0_g1~~TRINITY_DN2692_c0_g1_i3.p1  ORF type:complete len:1395 (+),score=138.36 TRINITY_DN2692_c0_g1_i3:550-4185(+)
MLVATQFAMLILAVDHYCGGGWDKAAPPFIELCYLFHGIMLISTRFTSKLSVFFLCPCDLSDAEYVLIEEGEIGSVPLSTKVPVRSSAECRFFEYTCVRYVFDEAVRHFRPLGTLKLTSESGHKTLSDGGLSSSEASNLLELYGANQIEVVVPPVLAALWNEFFNYMYIYQLFAIWSYAFYYAWNVATIWLFLVFGSGAWNAICIVRKNQLKVQDLARDGSDMQHVVLRDGKWISVNASDIVLGDIMTVPVGKVAADVVLLRGCAVVNETMLTGEAMPVQKIALESHHNVCFDPTIHGKTHAIYSGTSVIQAFGGEVTPVMRQHSGGRDRTSVSEQAVGIVVGVGGRTMRAQLIRMVLCPSNVKFKFTEQLPIVSFLALCYAAFVLIVLFKFQGQITNHAFLSVACFYIQCFSPMLPVSFTMGQTASAGRLDAEGIVSLSLDRIPMAGDLRVMVFDKTGTITHEGMDLCYVKSVTKAGALNKQARASELNADLKGDILLPALATCNSVTALPDGTYVGNAVDISIRSAVKWRVPKMDQERVFVSPDGRESYVVLRQLEFDRKQMTSGVVVRSRTAAPKTYVFIKGAHDRIEQIVDPSTVASDYKSTCDRHSSECYYLLAMGYKEINFTISDEEIMTLPREELEANLKLCGLLLFRNEMKEDSPKAIEELINGDTICVMCTGDSSLTGASIAEQCGIISEGAEVVVGDEDDAGVVEWRWREDKTKLPSDEVYNGSMDLVLTQKAFRSLLARGDEHLHAILPRIKVFGRMKPEDKVKVITLWQSFDDGWVTGMVGDGGNDCGALRVAHVGLALSEAEASMVSPFSSHKGLDTLGYMSLSAIVDIIKEGRACLATNMATFMLFMVYSLSFTTSRLVLVVTGDMVYGEWDFIFCDVMLGIGMVYTMTQCRAAESLANRRPTSALLGVRTVTSILGVLFIYWCFLAVSVYDLLYGSGEKFFEPFVTQHIEIPGQEWPKKGDNYLVAVFFLLTITAVSSAAVAFSFGDVFRASVYKNYRLALCYVSVMSLVFYLIWSSPTDLTCLFRINCDNRHSRDMSIPFVQSISVGNIGGAFLGPQLINCRSETGLCWVVPPNSLNLSSAWLPIAPRPTAPFNTYDEKKKYCESNPYVAGSSSNSGNRWCFYPDRSNNFEPDPPKPFEEPVPGCHGPNNCFSNEYKQRLSAVIVAAVLAIFLAIWVWTGLATRFEGDSQSGGIS